MNQISALFLAAVTFFQSLLGIKTIQPVPAPVTKIESVKVFLVPTKTDLEIHLSGNNQKLSAVAVRLVYQTPKNGLKIIPNAALVKDNWMFPVKKTSIKNDTTVFDLAAVSVSTTGHVLGSDLLLAKINISSADPAQFSFDQKETKLYDKGTNEVPLVF